MLLNTELIKKRKSKQGILSVLIIGLIIAVGGMTSSAFAISFGLGSGGTVNYAGGTGVGTPLSTTDGLVLTVDGTSIIDGKLNYTTGDAMLMPNSDSVMFAGGGGFTITGGLNGGAVANILLQGSFDGASTLTYNSASSSASYTALLLISSIDASLANILNVTGGTLTQITMSVSLNNQSTGLYGGFSGIQDSGTVNVTAVPEPASLVLLGSGLLGLGFFGMRKKMS